MSRETKIPSIPDIRNIDPDAANVLNAIKEIIEVREGLRGDTLDRFVTYRDLVDYLRNDETVVDSLSTDVVMEADFDATTFLYATSDNTPQPKTPAEVMAILSGEAAAAFDFNSQNLTSVGDITLDNLFLTAATTEQRTIELGYGRTGNGYAWVDLIGDATYTDYGLRLIRYNTGANANSLLRHRGTGILIIETYESGSSMSLRTYTTERLGIDGVGNVDIVAHNASTVGLKLGGTLVTASAADINLIKKSGRAQGDILYASATNTLAWLAKGSDNQILKMNGNVPNWEAEGGGVTDHGALTGLDDNDHGAIYYTETEIDTALALKAALASPSFTGTPLAPDHGTAAVDMLVNICYGTSDPPAANTVTEGGLFIKYTA